MYSHFGIPSPLPANGMCRQEQSQIALPLSPTSFINHLELIASPPSVADKCRELREAVPPPTSTPHLTMSPTLSRLPLTFLDL